MRVPIEKIVSYLPSIEKPTYAPSFKTKFKWTVLALMIYFIFSLIPIYGIHPATFERFKFFELVLGAKFGSLMTLGIGPIVTSGIILQLLVGSKIIDWKMDDEEDRRKFQHWSKFLAITFCFLQATILILGRALPVTGTLNAVLAIVQLALGGIIIVLLDELVAKWGLGSGISLIILAGVGSSIFISLFSPFAVYQYSVDGRVVTKVGLPSLENPPIGYFWRCLLSLIGGDMRSFVLFLVPILSTLIVFLVVIYVQDVGVRIPLGFAMMRGFERAWELKLLYTNVIPIILTSALIANFQLLVGATKIEALNSAVYFISPPTNLLHQVISGVVIPLEVLRAYSYTLFLVFFATIFSYFWMNTSGMDPESISEQLGYMGLQIPGFRRDPRTLQSVLKKYIPSLAILSGMIIGLLAALAEITGAIGSGTGILLGVMIANNYYEILKRERSEEMPPWIRRFLGG